MVQPNDFYVKTFCAPHKMAAVPDAKICALDIGYSGVKSFTDNSRSCFPSFARRVENADFFGLAGRDDILYQDDESTWLVGSSAMRDISLRDTNDSENTLYSRERYDSDMFKVIYRVGMGLCLLNEPEIHNGGIRPIYLQTGLPPAYLKSDEHDLVQALSGEHDFELKIGNESWKTFRFEVPANRISVMAQPMGSLYSASIDNNCRQTPEARDYFDSNLVVFDPGFGTLDLYEIWARKLKSYESFNNLGMKAVYKSLANRIYSNYGEVIPTHAIPKILQAGSVQVFDKKRMQTNDLPIAGMLEESNYEVCMEALTKLKVTYNYLREHKYLLITGGTGEAWKNIIIEHFAGMKNLHILLGNQNDPNLPQIFSNVRGYYLYHAGSLRRAMV